MEAFALYLLKSVIWLSGFTLVFFLFLRNERFFFLNRIYLLSGILTSFLFPFISVHYIVVLPSVLSIQTGQSTLTGISDAGSFNIRDLSLLMLALYISGALIVAFILLKQTRSLLRVIMKADITPFHPVKLIRTAEYTTSFSFFSYVFVNPSVTDIETKEIVNHELAHLKQKHWFDLLLVELLCMLQWFNPLVWIYVRFIRQNHEYLADEVALQRTADPAIYRATLLNQIVGSPVVNLANSFNYSTNKKRFNMMKKIIRSPYRKMKILLILPVFAIVLYSFAKPEYRYEASSENSGNKAISELQKKEVKGIVVQRDGTPLEGTVITIKGTTIGTITDTKGNFLLRDLPEDGLLVVSYVGFKSKVVKPVFNSNMKIEMERDTINKNGTWPMPPPPPPPPPIEGAEPVMDATAPTPPTPPASVKIRSENGKAPLVVVDGIIKDIDIDQIAQETIESISVLKDENARQKYGEKGKDGVVEITTKKDNDATIVKDQSSATQKNEKAPFVVAETYPEFPGGNKAMNAWISQNLKYPAEAAKNKITGKVVVNFKVTGTGKVSEAKISKSVSPLLNDEAIRLISSMPDWKPAMQAGKPVEVQIMVPIDFKLN